MAARDRKPIMRSRKCALDTDGGEVESKDKSNDDWHDNLLYDRSSFRFGRTYTKMLQQQDDGSSDV